jgi:hypothetical protein
MYIYGAPCKTRNFNIVYIYIYDNAEKRLFVFIVQCFNIESMQKVFPVSQLCVKTLLSPNITLITGGI